MVEINENGINTFSLFKDRLVCGDCGWSGAEKNVVYDANFPPEVGVPEYSPIFISNRSMSRKCHKRSYMRDRLAS